MTTDDAMQAMIDATPRSRVAWSDVRDASLPAELSVARAIATRAIEELLAERHDRSTRGLRIQAAIMRAFVAEWGPMAAGWCRVQSGGGVVDAWCCPRHSVPDPEGELSHEQIHEVAERAADALAQWRDHLARVAALIDSLPSPSEPLALERSVSRIADHVADATACSDAWYGHASQVIGWYLERHGIDRPEEIAREAVRGVWRSWTPPTPEQSARVVHSLRGEILATTVPDALELHRAANIDWWSNLPPDVVARENALAPLPADFDLLAPHLAAIEWMDGGREPGRAERMRAALDFVAERATSDYLTLSALQIAHGIAMGADGPSPLRTRLAFAKDGAEVYGLGASMELAPIGDPADGAVSEIACNYLHVCFWHPFDDGNGRAARLAAAWIDVRRRVGFSSLIPAFTVPRVAGDVEATWGLVRTLLTSAEAARGKN